MAEQDWDKYGDEKAQHSVHCIADIMHKGITPAEVAEKYDKWAADLLYEKDMEGLFTAPTKTAEALAESYPEDQRGNIRVMDVAAGSGLCGLKLYEHGFRHIDGLDPSQGMLDEARKKGVYGRLICAFINENRLDIEDDAYDAITVSAGFGEGHIPSSALHEMTRIVKPGGIIAIVTRAAHLETVEEYKDLEIVMAKLEADGKWKKVIRSIFPKFFVDKNGILWKYQVC